MLDVWMLESSPLSVDENQRVWLARSHSIGKKARDCHVSTLTKSAFFIRGRSVRAWSDYKFVIKKGMKLIRKSVTTAWSLR